MTNLNKPIIGRLCDYEIIQTDDGSFAINSDYFKEITHSTAGAREETVHNFINGCMIKEKVQESTKNNPLNILEIGFGLGVGFLETAKTLKDSGHCQFVSFEIDDLLVINGINDGPYQTQFKDFDVKINHESVSIENEVIKGLILLGDARKLILKEKLNEIKFHCVFQDAFSPKKNPTLWTKEWFKDINLRCHDQALLTTYSASARVRDALLSSGWEVEQRPGFAHKRAMSRAIKNQNKKLTDIGNPLSDLDKET